MPPGRVPCGCRRLAGDLEDVLVRDDGHVRILDVRAHVVRAYERAISSEADASTITPPTGTWRTRLQSSSTSASTASSGCSMSIGLATGTQLGRPVTQKTSVRLPSGSKK